MRAAVDVGTNTVRAVIAEVRNGNLEPVQYWRRITRLGGSYRPETGLSDEARSRTLDALKDISDLLARNPIEQVRAAGTAILREASNGQAFAKEVLAETGIPLEIIDGFEEARLSAMGVQAALRPIPDRAMIMDIGGGSTEFVFWQDGDVRFTHSYPLGVVRLCESFPEEKRQQARIDHVLAELCSDLQSSRMEANWQGGDFTLIGTAGTVTSLAALHLKMEEYDWRLINNTLLERHVLESQRSQLESMDIAQRERLPGMEKGRGDLILPGLRVILSVMQRFGLPTLTVSDFGLLEGLLLSPHPSRN